MNPRLKRCSFPTLVSASYLTFRTKLKPDLMLWEASTDCIQICDLANGVAYMCQQSNLELIMKGDTWHNQSKRGFGVLCFLDCTWREGKVTDYIENTLRPWVNRGPTEIDMVPHKRLIWPLMIVCVLCSWKSQPFFLLFLKWMGHKLSCNAIWYIVTNTEKHKERKKSSIFHPYIHKR